MREEAFAEAAARMASAQEDACASTVASSTQTVEDKVPDDIAQLVSLLYVSNVRNHGLTGHRNKYRGRVRPTPDGRAVAGRSFGSGSIIWSVASS